MADTTFFWLIELRGEDIPWYYEGPDRDCGAMFTPDVHSAMKFERKGAAQAVSNSLVTWLGGKTVIEHGFTGELS